MRKLVQPRNDDMDLGGFTVGKWKELRGELSRTTATDPKWEEAAKWMVGRLRSRYLDPIKAIKRDSYGPGFTIVTVLCALLEHLAAVETGQIFCGSNDHPYKGFDYRDNKKLYKAFLRRADIFQGYFFTKNGSHPPFCAKDFYVNVRCALVHEACTKNNWRINTLACGYPNPDGNLFVRDGHVQRIYRDVMVERIDEYMNHYLTSITHDRYLQFGLARKLDSLCEIVPDPKRDPDQYEWWRGLES